VRLFTALWPDPEVIEDLGSALRPLELPAGVRLVPPERWHLTLCFHGDCDESERERRVARLEHRVRDLTAPVLRLASAGVFRGVLWIGVEPAEDDDLRALRALVRAAGADPRGYRAHLTVARWSRGHPDTTALRRILRDYTGPWWRPREVTLVHSRLGPAGPTYTPLHRVPLTPEREIPER